MNTTTVFVQPWHFANGPRKLVIELYKETFTPLDVVAGIVGWITEDPVRLVSFQEYVDEGTETFTTDDAMGALNLLGELLATIARECPKHHVFVSSPEGWVN